jgi:hypothetical protein
MFIKDWSLRHDGKQHLQFPASEKDHQPAMLCHGHSWLNNNCSEGNLKIKILSILIVLIGECIVISEQVTLIIIDSLAFLFRHYKINAVNQRGVMDQVSFSTTSWLSLRIESRAVFFMLFPNKYLVLVRVSSASWRHLRIKGLRLNIRSLDIPAWAHKLILPEFRKENLLVVHLMLWSTCMKKQLLTCVNFN